MRSGLLSACCGGLSKGQRGMHGLGGDWILSRVSCDNGPWNPMSAGRLAVRLGTGEPCTPSLAGLLGSLPDAWMGLQDLQSWRVTSFRVGTFA